MDLEKVQLIKDVADLKRQVAELQGTLASMVAHAVAATVEEVPVPASKSAWGKKK